MKKHMENTVSVTVLSEPASNQSVSIDLSDLLGANQAFLAEYDPAKQADLIDAYCNKIGGELC